MLTLNQIVIDSIDASMSFETPPVNLINMIGYSVQGSITGTVMGTMKLQGSNDLGDPIDTAIGNDVTITTWTDILDSSEPINGSGSIVYNVRDTFYRWFRVAYSASSGTGTITITINTKGA